ncbi:GAF domain-containing protein [Candidatus Accumulibacter vicinus]|uniref:Fused phosphoenolpyruvate-protein phosphotransferase PtsP/GAF domain protein n=1 Tax=Candidatus Accumulibacter vicinus TaxID=2954382 RepID=A0A084XU40_9PROT|nr:GAF domain-containing protein [Candidatus Accumulibacter vicinus]KFB65984.1 MAG: fused phosphoenolpyruvate-protein phosphotransferase PtsP/GAF domain protein [Candidatus Accumulibacter vicinus]
MTLSLRSLRRCFEGAVPATIATCAADGMPNVAKLSHVHFVDDQHVALSYQFFNKTRENILLNHRATVEVVDPVSAAHFCLQVEYLRTETAGPLFAYMKARLAAIASHSGMSKVFRLLGSDIYRVLEVVAVSGDVDAEIPPRANLLSGLRAYQAVLAGCADLARLLDTMLEGLERHWDICHSMLLMADPDGKRLYTVASRGYAESGVGSEVCMGEGIVGVAARERTPIRIGYAVQEYRYSHATRERFAASVDGYALETEIPFPGLVEAGSQLAVPLLLGGRLLGVLLVESAEEQRFTFEDEDALVILAGQLAMCIDYLSRSTDLPLEPAAPASSSPPAAASQGTRVLIRHFPADHSVFVDNDYLIKGVAGAIIWKLLREHMDAGRAEFTNRELRLDTTLGLPDITDNLDARLILLQRRLAERCSFIAIEKTGRGRFRLNVSRPLQLSVAAPL